MDIPERTERLLSLLASFGSKRILVVGDLIADEFIYGEVSRVSREAPVLILKYDATEVVPGTRYELVLGPFGIKDFAMEVRAEMDGKVVIFQVHATRAAGSHSTVEALTEATWEQALLVVAGKAEQIAAVRP